MTPRHTPKKPAKKAGRKAGTFKEGHDPRRNLTKPGTGRPPDEFKARMRELATSAAVELVLKGVLEDKTSPNWLGALRYATEHGYGKPKEHVEHGVTDSLAALIAGTPKE